MSAYVTAVAGAGGKTGYIRRRAEKLAAAGHRVAILTTTHIREESSSDHIVYCGLPREGKLVWPGEEAYREICETFDEVLVEADGSKHYPMKIPASYEPVIPENTDEIVVLMGSFALGRRFDEVCFRKELAPPELLERVRENPVVTEELLSYAADQYYVKPLSAQFPEAKVRYELSGRKVPLRVTESRSGGRGECPVPAGSSACRNAAGSRRILCTLMASGSSSRFGPENKLLAPYRGKPLYLWELDTLEEAVEKLRDSVDCGEVSVDIAVCSCYDEIIEEAEHRGHQVIFNERAHLGQAETIKYGTEAADRGGYDAAAFFAADQPHFTSGDVVRMFEEYVLSGKPMACAFTDHPANPAVFGRKHFPELMELTGDRGAGSLLRNCAGDVHYYVVRPEKLMDIDTKEELRQAEEDAGSGEQKAGTAGDEEDRKRYGEKGEQADE